MGYVKNALYAIQEAGCLWLDEGVLERQKSAGHGPAVRRVAVDSYDGPTEVEALDAADGLRLLSVTAGDDHDAIADALADML
jgi:hypothetical protein